jgi:hypothetical protein
MADLATLQRTIYDQQRQTWQPVQEALLNEYQDFGARTDRVTAAGAEALDANADNAAIESRQLARLGPLSADAQAYRTRMQGLQGARNVVAARGMARQGEEERRIDTGMQLTSMGGQGLSQGMASLALADGMQRQREEAEAARKRAKRSGIGGMVGMAAGAALGAFGGPVGAMAGAQIGSSLGGGLA